MGATGLKDLPKFLTQCFHSVEHPCCECRVFIMRRAGFLTAFTDKLAPDYKKNIELNLLLMPNMRVGGRGLHSHPQESPWTHSCGSEVEVYFGSCYCLIVDISTSIFRLFPTTFNRKHWIPPSLAPSCGQSVDGLL